LIQICDGESAFLIDPLAVSDWSPLVAVLHNPRVVKVLHSCSEDIEVFLKLCGAAPAPLFDTQLAAAYLDMGFSVGYSRLVMTLLEIELSNEETRSNWLQRPLTRSEEHTSELQSPVPISYAVFCLKKKHMTRSS